jgi:hypothetical protein
MIEHLRKYTGLSIVIFAIAIIAFVLGDYSRGSGRMSGGSTVMKIAGRGYSDKDLNKFGKSGLDLTTGLVQSGSFDLYQFLLGLSPGAEGLGEEDAVKKFFVGRMILRDAKKEFGVHPGEDEITAYIRTLRVFAGADGKFNPETYNKFVDPNSGRLIAFGLRESDLRELTSDILSYKKINSIVGGGLVVDRDAVAKDLALQNQKITGEVAKLDIGPLQEKIQPTEEEIKKHWESVSDSFTTDPRRKFTYIIVSPKLPVEPKAEDEQPSIADLTASEEAKKEAAKKKEEEKAKRAAEFAEERRKKQKEADSLVDEFIFKIQDQKGAGFEELAKANQWDVKTSELFALSTPPADLDVMVRSSSRGGKAVADLFKIQETKDPLSKFSTAIPIGENQWLVARLDGEEKSRTKTYEEARGDARADFILGKATTDLKAAAEEAVTKIKTLLATGKTFAEAAKEAGINQTKAFNAINSTYRPDSANEPANLFAAARDVDPGAIADVITESDRSFILYVAKREVEKEANADARIDAEVSSRSSGNEIFAFSSWLSERIKDAKVEQNYSR